MVQLTQDILEKAGKQAAIQYNDQWFAIDLSTTGKPTEPGTVITDYQGQKFEVWLTKYWHQNQ